MVQTNSNLPTGYRFLNRHDPTTKKMRTILNVTSVLLWIVFGWLSLWLSTTIRPDFDGYGFINKLFKSGYFPLLKTGAFCILIVFLMGCVHEAIHGILFWIFSGKRPRFGSKFLLYTALAPGAYCSRNQAVVSALGPLLIITFLGLAFLLYVPVATIPVLLFFTFSNAASSIGDMVQSRWLLSHRRNVLFGFDGISSVVYEPIDSA